MKRVFRFLYVSFVLLMITSLIFWGFYDWNHRQEESLEKNLALFHSMADQIAQILKNLNHPAETSFSSLIKPKITHDPYWKQVLLYSSSRGLEYYWGPKLSHPLPSTTNLSLDFHKVTTPEEAAHPLTEHWIEVRIPSDKGDYQLKGLYTFYNASAIFDFLKLCGFVLVCLLIVTSLLMPLLGQDQPLQEDQEPSLTKKSPVPPIKQKYLDDDWNSTPSAQYEPKQRSTFVSALTPTKETPFFQLLEQELTHCINNKQDLSLVVFANKKTSIECHYLILNQEMDKNPLFQGQRFQYGENRFLIILPQKGLNDLFKGVQDFLWRIDQCLPQTLFYAGISARQGRFIDASTLANEAEIALLKAFSEPQRLVGLSP